MSLDFYQDQPHPCAYLDDRLARNIFPDPGKPVTNALYSQLIQHGFRRSGDHMYRPHCPACQACIPVRIDLSAFQANRTQRRCLRRNSDITLHIRPAIFSEEHFELYVRYQKIRHPGAGMDNPTEQSYRQFLTSYWSDSAFVELRLKEKLVVVAVTDFVADAASAFYTFYDPEIPSRSLGTLAILKQIELARHQRLSWLYLGYWIEASSKMRYKNRFSGLQYLQGQWQSADKNFE